MTPRLTVVCGQAGVGKSEVGRLIADALGIRLVGPDDFQGDWSAVYRQIDAIGAKAVVECVALPRGLRARVKERSSFVVLLTAAEQVRAERLLARGESRPTVDEWLADPVDIGYGEWVDVDVECRTDDIAPSDLAAQILAVVGGGGEPERERNSVAAGGFPRAPNLKTTKDL